jgi:uncharacterized protein (TIGR02171 family)
MLKRYLNLFPFKLKEMRAFFFILLTTAFYCSPTKVSSVLVDKAFPGMHCIFSKNQSFIQGSNEALASVADLEKPAMTCSFDYNYWIDTTEVTQKEFFDITGRKPLPDSIRSGRVDDYPVSFVNWYDAILFCNAKSRKFGLDTVYSYFSKDTVSTGSVIKITGLIIHYDHDGWRLPTEAEWEFAAREGSSETPAPKLNDSNQAKTIAWFDLNSFNTTHPVSQLAPNAFGLYDMAGNVFEWTNDWKGRYSSVGATDPIGAPAPDDYYEKTLKGGSFKHSFLYLRPSRRGGTYQASLSAIADFIGFRCARGPIPIPHYYTADSSEIAVNPFAIVSNEVSQFLGTSHAKLAFVNITGTMRNLCVIDFNHSIPVTTQFTDVTDVYDPAVSPDGRFVAFSNRGEGFGDPAVVSIRCIDSLGMPPWKLNTESAYVPRWWVDQSANDTCIIYTNSAIDNADLAWTSTKTFLQSIQGGHPVQTPRLLLEDGGFHDGISLLGQYTVTGYTKCIMRDLLYKEQRQLFVSPYNGKDASGSTQVCNVSISPDPAHPDRCLFLDFGSQHNVSSLVQTVYGIHEYLFIAEFSGNTIAWYKCPNTESSWDNPEWSNNPRFAIASCRNTQSDAHAIYCVNLDNKTSEHIVEGVELSQPALWIDPKFNQVQPCGFSVDSFGVYGNPFLSGNQVPFSYKMHLFWKMHKSLDAVFMGSSQVLSGIDCAKLSGLSAVNLGYAGAGVTTCANLIRDYVLPSCPQVKLIAMSAAIYWLGNPGGEGDDTWSSAITQSNGYLYDLHHNFWRDGFPDRFDDCILQAPTFNCTNCDTFGTTTGSCTNWGGSPPDMGGGEGWDWQTSNTNYIANISVLVKLIDELAAVNVQLLMINFPESPAYKNTDHYSRGGPSWTTGKEIVQKLRSLETSHSNFHFYDAYNDGNHDYTDADADNWNHLCPVGAVKLTTRVDSLIHTFISP